MNGKDLLLVARTRSLAQDGTARNIRTSAGLTLAEMASAIGVSAAAVNLWELGRRRPSGRAALRYARLLDRLAAEGRPDGAA